MYYEIVPISQSMAVIIASVVGLSVWLMTGTISGISENIALGALALRDLVVASSRNPSRLTQLTKAGATRTR